MNSKLNISLMSFNIDKKIKKQIQKIAREKGISMSALINIILGDYIIQDRGQQASDRINARVAKDLKDREGV